MVKGGAKAPENKPAHAKKWNLRLYVDGRTTRSIRAFQNLKRICEEHFAGSYTIEIIDLAKSPHLAAAEQIVALPTLVHKGAGHVLKLIGDLSDTEKVLAGLQLLM